VEAAVSFFLSFSSPRLHPFLGHVAAPEVAALFHGNENK